MTTLMVITWPVRREKVDEFWEVMLREREIMVRLGGKPTRYFESSSNPYLQQSEGTSAEPDEVLITGLFEYEDVDTWRAMEAKLAEEPEFLKMGARWQERRDSILARESTVMQHVEFDLLGIRT